jgi:hypothetical protein
MAYVQVSRAKEKTDLVFTVHQVKQMAEKTPPSEKMLQQAERLEQKPALDPKLEQLRDVVAAMSRSHQKESTLDHTPHVPPPGGPASPARDRETGLDLEL